MCNLKMRCLKIYHLKTHHLGAHHPETRHLITRRVPILGNPTMGPPSWVQHPEAESHDEHVESVSERLDKDNPPPSVAPPLWKPKRTRYPPGRFSSPSGHFVTRNIVWRSFAFSGHYVVNLRFVRPAGVNCIALSAATDPASPERSSWWQLLVATQRLICRWQINEPALGGG